MNALSYQDFGFSCATGFPNSYTLLGKPVAHETKFTLKVITTSLKPPPRCKRVALLIGRNFSAASGTQRAPYGLVDLFFDEFDMSVAVNNIQACSVQAR